jgi:hypothetical protein
VGKTKKGYRIFIVKPVEKLRLGRAVSQRDVSCVLQFVDGWELNGQFFPSAEDHPKPLSQRYREFCGQRRVKQVLQSSQNAALVQYRVPHRGNGFSFTARFPRNTSRE